MSNKLEITLVSDLVKQIELPKCPPLSEEGLLNLEKVMRKGLVLHECMGITPNERALPLHIHPTVILALIQEVRRSRG
jgi:hypothetical protein